MEKRKKKEIAEQSSYNKKKDGNMKNKSEKFCTFSGT